MPKTPADRIALAQAAFEAGFLSNAARKRAQEELSRAYNSIREKAFDAVRDHAFATIPGAEQADYTARNEIFRANDLPFDLHQVRDRHVEIVAKWSDDAAILPEMIALRAAIKAAEIAPAPAKPEIEVKAEIVRRSIVEEMERRKALFVEGMEIGRIFAQLYPRKDKDGNALGPSASLPVTVNAHWVHGHKGAVFTRNFFYLAGKLTPLNTIIAIADQLEREAEAA